MNKGGAGGRDRGDREQYRERGDRDQHRERGDGRDRERGDQIPLKLMVNKQTKATAHHFGFTDRGTLEVGMKVTHDRLQTARLPGLTTMLVGVCFLNPQADLNVIDFDGLHNPAPFYSDDLPTGASRWNQNVSGCECSACTGCCCCPSCSGLLTGVRVVCRRHDRLLRRCHLRGPQPPPTQSLCRSLDGPG